MFDSTSLLAQADASGVAQGEAIVSLDGTSVDHEALDAVTDEE
jgi:hypothetical protein